MMTKYYNNLLRNNNRDIRIFYLPSGINKCNNKWVKNTYNETGGIPPLIYNNNLCGINKNRVNICNNISNDDAYYNSCNAYYEITNYRTNINYKLPKKDRLPFYNMLVWDFDTPKKMNSNKYGDIKKRITTSEDYDTVLVLQDLYRNWIIQKDILRETFEEVIRFKNYLINEFNVSPYVVFSGCKGFHLYLFSENNIPAKYLHYGFRDWSFKIRFDELSLNTMDDSVYKNIKGHMIRLPNSIHPITGWRAFPVPDNINNYTVFKDFLCNYDNRIIKYVKLVHDSKIDIFIKELNELGESLYYDEVNKKLDKELKWQKLAKKSKNKHNKYEFIDLRTLPWDNVTNYGDSLWCNCPFHSDNKPSLHVYERAVYCSVCGTIPFKDIKDYFGL